MWTFVICLSAVIFAGSIVVSQDTNSTETPLADLEVNATSIEWETDFNCGTDEGAGDQSSNDTEDFSSCKICFICSCPQAKLANPYTIDCRSLNLNGVPAWDPRLNEVDNVHLDLSGNQFHIVPPFEKNNYIDALFFNRNSIDSVTANSFSNLPHLKHLTLYGNKIRDIHKSAFCGKDGSNSALEILDLSGNDLATLDHDLFECAPNLRVLNLAENSFMDLDKNTQAAFNTLSTLQNLDLSRNALRNLPLELENPVSFIDTLNLAKNKLKDVPEVLQSAHVLTTLILNDNPIAELNSASFIGLDQLTTLSISNMTHLTIIKKGTFQPLSSLKYLEVKFNPSLQTIEPLVFGDRHNPGPRFLESVNISYNQISNLSYEILNGTHIHTLDLRGNPMFCTCETVWLRNENFVYISNEILQSTICVGPADVQGKSLYEVDFQSSTLSCPTKIIETTSYSHVFLIVLTVTVVILILLCVAFMVRNRRLRGNKYNNLQKDQNGFNKFNEAFDPNLGEEFEEYSRYPHVA